MASRGDCRYDRSVRLVLLVALAAGCYSPSAPPNVPCDPASPHCPIGQTCMGVTGAAVCSGTVLGVLDAPDPRDATPIDAPDAMMIAIDAMPDAMPDALVIPDAMVDAMLAPLHADYHASVVVCMDPTMPSLTACTDNKGPSQFTIDGEVTTPGTTFAGYLRFDLDAQLVGHTPMVVTLVLTDSGVTSADSDSSGEVWSVQPFTQSSLATTAPAQLGTGPIAPAQGPIALGQIVTFALPVGLVAPNGSVFLGMYSASGDGVQYWDNTGTTPPRLHIDAN